MPSKTTKKRTAADSPMYSTQSQLAEALGVAQPTVSRRLRESGCPIAASGPWDADDAATLRDWLAGDDGDVSDRLKRAQAIKAETLAAKYTLGMLTEAATVGSELFDEFGRALGGATLIHFRRYQHKLGDVFRERGGMDASEADREAERFIRQYMNDFADEMAKAFRFHTRMSESLRPVILHAERVAKNLRQLGDLHAATLDNLDEKIHETKEAIGYE